MAISEIYHNMEDKYYKMLDWLDSKGIPLYKVDDWLYKHGIKSFPVFLVLILLIIISIVFLILYGGSTKEAYVSLTFKDANRQILVADLAVSITINGSESLSLKTDSTGSVSFTAPLGSEVSVAVQSEDYSLSSFSFIVDSESLDKEVPLKYNGSLISKTFYLYDGKDSSLQTLYNDKASLDVYCSENTNYYKSIEVEEGSFTLDDLSPDCGYVVIEIKDPIVESKSFSLDEENPAIVISATEEAKANLLVTVLNEDGNAMPNASVQVMTVADDITEAQGVTSESGTVSLEVSADKNYYLVVRDLSGVYAAEYTNNPKFSENAFTFAPKANESVSKTIKLTQKSIGSIKLNIKDNLGNPVEDATIKVYKDNIEEATGSLTEPGYFEYAVGENFAYRIVIDAPGFMLKEIDDVSASESIIDVVLQKEKSNPPLSVQVLGSDNNPVDNATVQLFNDKDNLLLTKTSDSMGNAVFESLAAGKTYYVKAIKGNFSASSQKITLSGKTENTLQILLNIGYADVLVKVYNTDNVPVMNASVEFYALDGKKLNSEPLNTDDAGEVSYTIRADKDFYVKVKKDSSVFYSLPYTPNTEAVTNVDAYVLDNTKSLSISFLKLVDESGNEIAGKPLSLMYSNNYRAYFILNVPEGASYDEMGAFFKVSNSKELGDSAIVLKSVSLLNASVRKGSTFNAPDGYSDDLINLTSKEAVWAEAKSNSVMPGSYLIALDFATIESIEALSGLEFRAWLKKGSSYIRDPFDSELGQSESSANKYALYAKRKKLVLKLGDLDCKNTFCTEYILKGKSLQKVKDKAVVELNRNYIFDIRLSSLGDNKSELSKYTLRINSENNALKIKNPSVKINGKAIAVSKNSHSINFDFDELSNVSVSFAFNVQSEGDNLLSLSILDSAGEELYKKDIVFSVLESKMLDVSLQPSLIVPFIENKINVSVKDSDSNDAVKGAFVNLYVNNKLISTNTTNADGNTIISIPALVLGDKVLIEVLAPSYKKESISLEASQNILSSDAPELKVVIDRSEKDYTEGSFVLKNLTPLKIKIKKVYLLDNGNKEFVDFKLDKSYSNFNMPNDEAGIKIKYKAVLTKGKLLLEPKSFKTDLVIEMQADSLDYKWKMALPVSIYIKLGGAVDDDSCFKLRVNGTSEPMSIILTQYKNVELNVELENNCTVNNQEIYLYKPSLAVHWKSNSAGRFYYNNSELKGDFELLSILPPGISSFNIVYKPDPKKKFVNAKLDFVAKAKNATANGLQELEAKVSADLYVSQLNKCVQIISGQGYGFRKEGPLIVLNVDPYFSLGIPPAIASNVAYGLGSTQLRAGSLPLALDPRFSFNPGRVSDRARFYDPSFASNNALLSNASFGYATSVSGAGLLSTLSNLPPEAAIEIKNNCTYPVDIKLQSMPQILISSPSLSLQPKEQKSFRVRATSMVGQYAVFVYAGVETMELMPITQIPVIVRDFMSEASRSCFYIEGGDTLDFSKIGLESSLKRFTLYNKCYSRGVRFDPEKPLEEENLFLLEDIADVKKGTAYVKVHRVGSPSVETKNGMLIESLPVSFLKNPAILEPKHKPKMMPKSITGKIAELSALRESGAEALTLKDFPAILRINTIVGGINKSVEKEVKIRDSLQYLGLISSISGAYLEGDPNCTVDKWGHFINERLDVPFDITEDQISDNRFSYTFEGTEAPVIISSDCFGALTKIEYKGNLSFEKNGIKYSLHTRDRGQVLELSVTMPDSLKKGKYHIEKDIPAVVKKAGLKKTVTFKISFDIVLEKDYSLESSSETHEHRHDSKDSGDDETVHHGHNHGTEEDSGDDKKVDVCKEEYGPEYGLLSSDSFNDLSFDWDKDINCSSNYCDSRQFFSYLFKKKDNIKNIEEDKWLKIENKVVYSISTNLPYPNKINSIQFKKCYFLNKDGICEQNSVKDSNRFFIRYPKSLLKSIKKYTKYVDCNFFKNGKYKEKCIYDDDAIYVSIDYVFLGWGGPLFDLLNKYNKNKGIEQNAMPVLLFDTASFKEFKSKLYFDRLLSKDTANNDLIKNNVFKAKLMPAHYGKNGLYDNEVFFSGSSRKASSFIDTSTLPKEVVNKAGEYIVKLEKKNNKILVSILNTDNKKDDLLHNFALEPGFNKERYLKFKSVLQISNKLTINGDDSGSIEHRNISYDNGDLFSFNGSIVSYLDSPLYYTVLKKKRKDVETPSFSGSVKVIPYKDYYFLLSESNIIEDMESLAGDFLIKKGSSYVDITEDNVTLKELPRYFTDFFNNRGAYCIKNTKDSFVISLNYDYWVKS